MTDIKQAWQSCAVLLQDEWSHCSVYCPLQTDEKFQKHGDGGEMSVKRNKPQPTKKKMTDAEIYGALRKCF